MKLIFLGPPGAGKGTQAARIAGEYGIAHISTGELLRAEMREGTPLGMSARGYVERGELVPDEVILGMVKGRILADDCKGGFLFDGFPRTLAQAEALGDICAIDAVIDLAVPDERLVERISGRRMCPACGATYHVSTHDSPDCDCGAALYQREDDRPETVENRLAVYRRSTEPLIGYYRSKGLLTSVDGDAGMDNVTEQIRSILSK